MSHLSVLAERSSGDVLKLLGPTQHSPWLSFPNQSERFVSYARHLLPLTDVERARWLDKRAEPDPDWWGCLDASAARRTGGTAETAYQWRMLRLALHRAAVERGVYPSDQAAVTEAGLLTAVDLEPDDAVRRWLATAAMPVSGDIPAARRLRDQIHQVEPVLPRLADPEVAAGLRRWIAVKPNLLAD